VTGWGALTFKWLWELRGTDDHSDGRRCDCQGQLNFDPFVASRALFSFRVPTTTDAAATESFADTLAELMRAEHFHHKRLGGLSRAEVEDIVVAATGVAFS
jgi:hypothetical protein